MGAVFFQALVANQLKEAAIDTPGVAPCTGKWIQCHSRNTFCCRLSNSVEFSRVVQTATMSFPRPLSFQTLQPCGKPCGRGADKRIWVLGVLNLCQNGDVSADTSNVDLFVTGIHEILPAGDLSRIHVVSAGVVEGSRLWKVHVEFEYEVSDGGFRCWNEVLVGTQGLAFESFESFELLNMAIDQFSQSRNLLTTCLEIHVLGCDGFKLLVIAMLLEIELFASLCQTMVGVKEVVKHLFILARQMPIFSFCGGFVFKQSLILAGQLRYPVHKLCMCQKSLKNLNCKFLIMVSGGFSITAGTRVTGTLLLRL